MLEFISSKNFHTQIQVDYARLIISQTKNLIRMREISKKMRNEFKHFNDMRLVHLSFDHYIVKM